MLGNSESFGSFSCKNLEVSKKFYAEKLGIEVTTNAMGLLELHLKDGKFLVYQKPDHKPAQFTVLNFYVGNIEKTVDELGLKGIEFEHYQGKIKTNLKAIHKGENGPAIAWFKDPSGNIFSIIEQKTD